MKKILLTMSLSFTILSPLWATPKNVIIIRHAEKIPGESHLNLRGHERAAALAYYFSGTPLYNDPAPTHIFAAALSEQDGSIRPIQTCTPIANHYNLPLNIAFKRTETDQLAQELLKNPKYDGSTVLICWSHGHIKPIILALGGEDPGKWSNETFDQVYLLAFDGSNKPKLQKILQKLMFGDRSSFADQSLPLPPPTTKRVDQD